MPSRGARVVPLSGNARIKHGERFYQSARDKTVWLRAEDIGRGRQAANGVA